MKYLPIPLLLAVSCLCSCTGQQFLATEYYSPLAELVVERRNYEHVIQTDDKLTMSVWNHNDMSIGSLFSIYNSNEAFGKWVLVDREGYVTLPEVGRIQLAGKTCREAEDTLIQIYAEILVDPVIEVKVLNKSITVLGEVRTPGTYVVDKEYTSVTEMIGQAQGYLYYSDVSRIQLHRQGKTYLLDLTSIDEQLLYNIPVISGDIIVVPSRKGKNLDKKSPTIIPWATLATSVALLISVLGS